MGVAYELVWFGCGNLREAKQKFPNIDRETMDNYQTNVNLCALHQPSI